jgi:TRAP-type C4-dicarboxylate transport system substrate-binding protein
MKRITFLTFLFFCFSILFSFSATAKTQLTYANFFPPTHGQSKLAESWCKEVEKRTNGEITIKYYPSSTLLNPATMYDGVVNGIADIGFTVLAYSRGRFAVAAAIDLPMGYTSGVQATKVANAVYNKFHPKEFKDTQIMYLHAHGPGVLHTVSKQINTLADIKGLKIRGTGTSGLIVNALGGSAVGKSMREAYTMLQKGVVDGSLQPFESDKGWKLGEVVHYAVKAPAIAYTTTFAVFMNKDKWNSLTPAQQKIIREINAEWAVKHGQVWDSDDAAGIEFFKSKGGKITTLSASENAKWEKAVAPVIDAYIKKVKAKGIDGKAVVDFIKANM